MTSNIGQRLKAVQKHIGDDEYFLANYSDGLSDVDLDELMRHGKERDAVATFVTVRPPHSFHSVKMLENGKVQEINDVNETDFWINGGFFMLKNEIFDYIEEGEELVEEPFQRLAEMGKLYAKKHEGFWQAMDTLKDKKQLDSIYESGVLPWDIWNNT